MTKRLLLIILILILAAGSVFYITEKRNVISKKEALSGFQTFDLSDKEMETLLKKVKTGDGEAAFKIAQYYEIHKEDEKQGHYWLKKSASLGYPIALYNLGVYYEYNQHDLKNAIHWYWKAAQQGDANGALEEALYLEETEDNLDIYIEKAKAGEGWASYRLYNYYYYKYIYLTENKDKNFEQSKFWLKLAAKQGNRHAQFELGQLYERDDIEKAIYWYQKAEDQTYPEAKRRLDELSNPFNRLENFIHRTYESWEKKPAVSRIVFDKCSDNALYGQK